MPVNLEDGCVVYLWEPIWSASVPEVLLFRPLLIDVSPGRNITENPPLLLLFITVVSSDGDEHVSDLVSRNRGEPDRCIVRGSTVGMQCFRKIESNFGAREYQLTVCARHKHRTSSIGCTDGSHQAR